MMWSFWCLPVMVSGMLSVTRSASHPSLFRFKGDVIANHLQLCSFQMQLRIVLNGFKLHTMVSGTKGISWSLCMIAWSVKSSFIYFSDVLNQLHVGSKFQFLFCTATVSLMHSDERGLHLDLIYFCCLCYLQDAVTMVQHIQDAQEAAKRLTDEAFKKGSADNITCVVIRFHHPT